MPFAPPSLRSRTVKRRRAPFFTVSGIIQVERSCFGESIRTFSVVSLRSASRLLPWNRRATKSTFRSFAVQLVVMRKHTPVARLRRDRELRDQRPDDERADRAVYANSRVQARRHVPVVLPRRQRAHRRPLRGIAPEHADLRQLAGHEALRGGVDLRGARDRDRDCGLTGRECPGERGPCRRH